MQINTNLDSLAAQESYRRSGAELASSVQRLSSGLRINSARDDAAGLAISERLSARLGGDSQAARNTNDGISLLQVADGSIGVIVEQFQRLRELAVQAANGSNSSSDRLALQGEAEQLLASSYQIANDSKFNHLNLLDGSYSSQIQVGANAGDTIALTIPPVFLQRSSALVAVSAPLRQVNLTAPVVSALGAGDLSINAVAIGASLAGAGPGQGAGSAYAIAIAINAANVLGITAVAANSLSANVMGGAAIPGGGLAINGIAIGAISGLNTTLFAASAAAAITAAGAGVTASSSGATLSLSTADGRDIDISETLGGYAAALGLGAGAHHGTLNLSDTATGQAHAVTVGGNNPSAAGLSGGLHAATLTGETGTVLEASGGGGEQAIDLSSFAGATAALTYIDAKIDSSNVIRSMLGATENRLSIVYGNLVDGVATLSAARSRILDTDYASETAQLTRSQILQQAGVAMLAQANALPGHALQLLR
ncbi:flagellin [Oxalobacteraceae bacterium GrIS 1.11]